MGGGHFLCDCHAAHGQFGVDEGHSREPHQAVGTDGERNGNDESVREGTRNEDYYDRNTHGTAVVDLWHHQTLYGLWNLVTVIAAVLISISAVICLVWSMKMNLSFLFLF